MAITLAVIAAGALIGFGTVLRDTNGSGRGPRLLGGPQVSNAGGKFAGYRDGVIVHSVAARWRVPTVSSRSRIGAAATWIGAQAPGNNTAPFIQIGTEETMLTESDGARSATYEAFFSDTARHFHPDPLFAVRPGDEIGVSMRLSNGRWTASIHDATSGQVRTLVTSQEADGTFTYAEWTQEDVTSAATNRALQYPDVADAHLEGLRVNGAAPTYGQLQSTWMSLPGGYLAPTPLRADGFSDVPTRLSPAGAAYLRIIGPEDAAALAFQNASAAWRASTPQATVHRDTDRLAAALVTSSSAMRAVRWPASVAGLIHQAEIEDGAQATQLRHAANFSAVQAALDQPGSEREENDVTEIRRDLGVQEAR